MVSFWAAAPGSSQDVSSQLSPQNAKQKRLWNACLRQVGVDSGEGTTVNVAWDGAGMGDADYLAAFHHLLLPIASQFAPTLIIVSAGFDAAEGAR